MKRRTKSTKLTLAEETYVTPCMVDDSRKSLRISIAIKCYGQINHKERGKDWMERAKNDINLRPSMNPHRWTGAGQVLPNACSGCLETMDTSQQTVLFSIRGWILCSNQRVRGEPLAVSPKSMCNSHSKLCLFQKGYCGSYKGLLRSTAKW